MHVEGFMEGHGAIADFYGEKASAAGRIARPKNLPANILTGPQT